MNTGLRTILGHAAAGAGAAVLVSWTCVVLEARRATGTLDEWVMGRSAEMPGALGPGEDQPNAPRGAWPRPVPAAWPPNPTYRYIARGAAVTVDATLDYYPGCKGWWGHGIARISAGWPMRALSYELVHSDSKAADWQWGQPANRRGFVATSIWSGGLPAPSASPAAPGGDPAWGRLPLRPIPVGFAANASCFGLAAWLMMHGPRRLREIVRRRRGACEGCGYDAHGLTHCPECGRQTPVSART